ncbi:hypothetical protein GH714_007749 [Hevea brasiliensis]|uniref:F-box domain-containing protein n=1 Tax=Hevea brasiliensis TaxID=3981 RepID=A0A6A6LJ42_HEVBR|nr:hypothetical protein GH714_007749 [Hevea brasiliensis]
MAFECQGSTEVSKNYNFEDNSNPKAKNSGIANHILDCDSKTAISIADCSKQLPCNEVLPNCPRSITDLPPALICEILNFLDPKELGIVSCASTILNRLASENHVWKEVYCERWGLPSVPAPLGVGLSDEKSWKELFVEREFRSRTFLGRYSIDILYGHSEAVRTVFLLASAKLIFTSGYDSIVRMWDMENGLSIASSRPLGCTIRAVAADTKLLVAGGTDGFIQGWRAVEAVPCLFNLKGSEDPNTEFKLWEHGGPITSLALDLMRIYSGSWDMTLDIGADRIVCGGEEGVVRIWNFTQALEIEQRARALRRIRLENRMRRRKLQIEMNKGARTDQCSMAAKNSMHGDTSNVWHSKRGISSKVKA